MEINVRDDNKLVEIWLTNEEKGEAALREQLQPLYREYKAKNYLVAVFQSGGRNLTDATSDLLCHNRKRFAEKEAQRQRQQGMTMGM